MPGLRGKEYYSLNHLAGPVVNKTLLKNKNDFQVVLIIFYLLYFTMESYTVVQDALELTVPSQPLECWVFFFKSIYQAMDCSLK